MKNLHQNRLPGRKGEQEMIAKKKLKALDLLIENHCYRFSDAGGWLVGILMPTPHNNQNIYKSEKL